MPQGNRNHHAQARKPVRMCAACRSRREKTELIRLTRIPSGRLVIDRSGKQGGRGVYLCPSPTCWQVALKRRSLERALRVTQLHPEDRAMVMRYMQELADLR